MSKSVIVLAVLVTVVACRSDEPSVTTSPSLPQRDTTTTLDDTTTTTNPSATTTTSPEITTTTGAEIDVEIAGGEVEGPNTFEITAGESVDIWILSDVDDEVHVHGYDLRFDLAGGAPFQLSFEADVPGVFEVETHRLQEPLFEIEVTG